MHYFGLTQNFDKVIDLCREYSIRIIEDASHSFMSQFFVIRILLKAILRFLACVSFYQLLMVALRINNCKHSLIKTYNSQYVTIIGNIRYLALRLFEKLATRIGINIYSKLINNIRTKLRSKNSNATYDFHTNPC